MQRRIATVEAALHEGGPDGAVGDDERQVPAADVAVRRGGAQNVPKCLGGGRKFHGAPARFGVPARVFAAPGPKEVQGTVAC
eukprot:3724460-Rhodomonas_salina.1